MCAGPVHTPSAGVFDDFEDEQSQTLLGSLHIEADEEPVRRGASRANSVRFDVSAIQGSGWTQGSRSSGEFAPARPNSGIGSHPMTERSLSHKSDGRHSSAGHSVHSAPSGRTSSLGLDTTFLIGGQGDESPLDIPEPPPGLFILGTVPSIIRCWLNQNFSHGALLYAVVSTGSQKSHLDYSLVKELGLEGQMQRNGNGSHSIRLPVYLPEAVITQPSSRANSPAPQLPTLTATFEVSTAVQAPTPERTNAIRVFLGSDTLRAHSADLLLSRNLMTLYGDDKTKVSVPFVRPEDENLFRHLCTTNVTPEKVELKATAPEFTPVNHQIKGVSLDNVNLGGRDRDKVSTETQENGTSMSSGIDLLQGSNYEPAARIPNSSVDGVSPSDKKGTPTFEPPEDHPADSDGHGIQSDISHNNRRLSEVPSTTSDRQEPSGGIWGSWRMGSVSKEDVEASRETASGGYQRANRGGRSMKVLKPSKVTQNTRSTSGARTGLANEAPTQRISGDSRRKSQGGASDSHTGSRWESKRDILDEKVPPKEIRPNSNAARSSNPVGGASAFAWMNQGKPIGTQARVD